MPKRIRKQDLDADPIETANRLIRETTGGSGDVETLPNPAELSRIMKALGARGGRIGGKRRAENMTRKERSAAARIAARARWGNRS